MLGHVERDRKNDGNKALTIVNNVVGYPYGAGHD
jgi:hypothetical protein